MNDKIMEFSQGVFDRLECIHIQHRPQWIDEISRIMGELIFFGSSTLSPPDRKWISEELEYLLNSMSKPEIQDAHILLFGKEHDPRDIIPF